MSNKKTDMTPEEMEAKEKEEFENNLKKGRFKEK